MSLCKYKNIFGKIGEGFHSSRLFNIAMFDLVGTLLIAIILAYYLKYNFIIIFILLIIFSILIHKLFCVPTTLTKVFFTF
jgi:hypothetical protein